MAKTIRNTRFDLLAKISKYQSASICFKLTSEIDTWILLVTVFTAFIKTEILILFSYSKIASHKYEVFQEMETDNLDLFFRDYFFRKWIKSATENSRYDQYIHV